MARKKVSPERLAEAHKEGAARLAAWREANKGKPRPASAKQLNALARARQRRSKRAVAKREAWLARAQKECADMCFGDVVVYRGRAFVCLGSVSVTTPSGDLPGTLFGYWCIDCGASCRWSFVGGSERLPVATEHYRKLRVTMRCRKCATVVKQLPLRDMIQARPFGYAEEALASMSDADRRFVCEAVATHIDIG